MVRCVIYTWTLITALTLTVWPQAVKLVPSDTTILQAQWHRPIQLPARCDANGNIYFRGLEQGNPSSPVYKAQPGSYTCITFALDGSDTDLRLGTVQDFAVSAAGVLFELVQSGDTVYIARFGDDGSFKSKIKLERPFWASHLSVLANDAWFLVTGTELQTKGGPPPALVSKIVDESGRDVSNLTFEKDPAALKEAPKGKPKIENYWGNKSILPLVLGDTQTGIDGSLYVMRASTAPVIFVLDSTGQLTRRITVQPPEAGMTIGNMQVSAGRIALLFYRADTTNQVEKSTMVLVDARSGKVERAYEVDARLGSAFACYDGNSFAFLSTQEGKFAIVSAKPQ